MATDRVKGIVRKSRDALSGFRSDSTPEEPARAESSPMSDEPPTPAATEETKSSERVFDPNPTVAIVVPAWNEDRFLRPCLRSIREQWFNSWECIIVDDGSTDMTREIADEFAQKDSRFRVVSHTESLGLAASRNSGIELTTAPYITFLDADDFLYQHSLQSRLKTLRGAGPNVAGSYCDWQPTREKQGRKPPQRSAADKRSVVSFIDGPECPFIATAPLVRRDVVEDLGGFNEALPTAEDFDLWARMLRSGYTFVYTAKIGVAYRQKASGMVFTDTAMHAAATDEIISWQYRDLTDEIDRPMFYRPLPAYDEDLVRSRRLLRSLALSAAVGDADGQKEIRAMMPDSLPLLATLGLDIRFELGAGLSRAGRALSAFNNAEVRHRVIDELETAVLSESPTHAEVSEPATAGRVGTLSSSDRASRRSVAPLRPSLTETAHSTEGDLGVLLVPMARYHAIEMLSLQKALNEQGVESTFLVVESFATQFADLIAGSRRYEYSGDPTEIPAFSGVYMMNDWGMTRELILEARQRGVPTFARVEGVQDFRDVDTGRIRLPYQTADLILAQGQNDLRAINHRQTKVVGNGRLERLVAAPERTAASASGRAVINSNFTFGVFTELRDQFVEVAIRSCLDAGLQPVISQHPADKELPEALRSYCSRESMSDLLHVCDVLISRFSTVPFEAMAIGTPFVYFRPQVERVPTFDQPNGAYETASSRSELSEALVRAAGELGNYRSISAEFFGQQIDICEASSDKRTAVAIAETIAVRS